MKKILFFLTIAVTVGFLNSCDSDDLANQKSDELSSEIALDEAIQSVIVDDVLKVVDLYSTFGEGILKSAEIVEGDCPVVTVEKIKDDQEWPRKITIDYGEGCEKNSKQMSGKIVIVKTGPWNKPGSVREVAFENYVVDGISIGGSKRIKNITENDGAATFSIGINMELITRKNEKVVQKVIRKAEKTQVWIEGFGKRDVPARYIVSGDSKILIVRGDREKVIDKKMHNLLMVAGCKFPQEGISKMSVRNFDGVKLEFTIDYAAIGSSENCQGDCDCIATLLTEETSKDIDLSKKWRK